MRNGIVAEWCADPYRKNVTLFADEGSMAKYLKKYEPECEWYKGKGGGASYYIESRRECVIGIFDRNHSSLAHECTHATLEILEKAGIHPFEARGEPMAYLLAELVHRATNALRKHGVKLREYNW